MPIMSLLNQAKGPLPLFVTFSAPSDGPACLVVSGSVWTGVANQTIGIGVELDGKAIGSAAIFSNAATTHRAVVPSYIPITLTFGSHKIALGPFMGPTTSDVNDVFDVALLY